MRASTSTSVPSGRLTNVFSSDNNDKDIFFTGAEIDCFFPVIDMLPLEFAAALAAAAASACWLAAAVNAAKAIFSLTNLASCEFI